MFSSNIYVSDPLITYTFKISSGNIAYFKIGKEKNIPTYKFFMEQHFK